MPGSMMPSPYALRWDQREDFDASDTKDCEWIGEDSTGVWCRRHPQAALLEDPDLWPIVTEWQSGLRDFTAEEFNGKSNFEFEGKLTMSSAHAREEQRRIKRPREDSDG